MTHLSDKYPQIKAAAVKEGLIEAKDLPNQFVPQIIISLLIGVFYVSFGLNGIRMREEFKKRGL